MSAPVEVSTTISTDPIDSNMDGTAHPERSVLLKAIGPTTLTPLTAATDLGMVYRLPLEPALSHVPSSTTRVC
jgi:hypothetical protein